MDEALLLELIENGVVRHKDKHRVWIAPCFPDRADNLLCVAAVVEIRGDLTLEVALRPDAV